MTHWTKAILPFVMRLSRDALIIVGPPGCLRTDRQLVFAVAFGSAFSGECGNNGSST
jgi:hypothetical protein